MRMLAAYKPSDTDFPVLLVSTHDTPKNTFITEALFTFAATVDDAVFELVSSGPSGRTRSGWIQTKTHADLYAALQYGGFVAEALQVREHHETRGLDLYRQLYKEFCPDTLKLSGEENL